MRFLNQGGFVLPGCHLARGKGQDLLREGVDGDGEDHEDRAGCCKARSHCPERLACTPGPAAGLVQHLHMVQGRVGVGTVLIPLDLAETRRDWDDHCGLGCRCDDGYHRIRGDVVLPVPVGSAVDVGEEANQ